MQKLKLGIAYHGNRMLQHVEQDMQDIAMHHMNLCTRAQRKIESEK